MVNLAVDKAKFAEVQLTKSWPSPQDYNEAMQNPAINLSAPELKVGKTGLNKLGLPKSITGAFASVYYLDCPKQDFAVRCFLHNIADQKERYAKISDCLNKIALPIMADFDYLDKGILTRGRWYPILKMDWVDGQNLIEYIGRNIDNAKVLKQLRLWLRQARHTLKEHGIAHGDLQHGNVLVGSDSIKLVDYDGMFVPELAGQMSNELGHRNYQHPGRKKEDFGPYLDNFSAWLIDTCLYVLERDPRVWLTLHAGEDCLLFREKDLQDPYSSFAFHELESHPNPEIRERVKLLRSFLLLPVDQVPDINAEDVRIPADLPALDAEKKKPDWLTSAQHLMAKEPGPNIYDVPPEVPKSQSSKPYVSHWWKSHPANPLNQQTNQPTYPYVNQPAFYNRPLNRYEEILAWLGLIFMLFMIWTGNSILSRMAQHHPPATPVAQEAQSKANQVQIYFDKGTQEYTLGNYQSALGNYQDALSILESQGKGKTVEAANCNYWAGRMQMQLKHYGDAFQSLAISETIYSELGLTADVAKVNHTYGLVYLYQNKYADAIPMFEEALDGFEREPASQGNEDCKADVSYYLGMAYAGNHQDKEATKLFKRYIDYYEGTTSPEPDYVVSKLRDISRYFAKHRQISLANRAQKLAKEILVINGGKP